MRKSVFRRLGGKNNSMEICAGVGVVYLVLQWRLIDGCRPELRYLSTSFESQF